MIKHTYHMIDVNYRGGPGDWLCCFHISSTSSYNSPSSSDSENLRGICNCISEASDTQVRICSKLTNYPGAGFSAPKDKISWKQSSSWQHRGCPSVAIPTVSLMEYLPCLYPFIVATFTGLCDFLTERNSGFFAPIEEVATHCNRNND